MEYHDLEIVGLKRKLPLIRMGKNTRFASFSLLGDVKLVSKLSIAISKKLKGLGFDYLVGPEVKVVPLIQSVANRLGHKRFVVCRKSVKPYMISPVVLKPLSYFPKHARPLVIDGEDAKLIKNKKVVVIDDVVSTGVTMRMIKKLMENANAEVVQTVVALKQGEQFDKSDDIISFGKLPVFKS